MLNVFLTQYDGAFLGPIAKLLGIVLNVMYEFLGIFGIHNVGLSIILFTFLVNGLMIPLTLKQQKYSKLSAKMSPELQKIQQRYKNKKDEASMRAQQDEMQMLYNKYGTSPTAGCLPMLITLPIIFALYRVIYNIPAYVTSIKDIYEQVAVAIQGVGGYEGIMSTFIMGQPGAIEGAVNVITKKWGDISGALAVANPNSVNYIIDILTQFRESHWTILTQQFPTISGAINTVTGEIATINNFLGLNIANLPSWKSISVLIPVLSVATQFLQTKLMTTTSAPTDQNNQMASTMKTMNTVMPLFSGVICFMMPIGVGIYWIAGSVFRIIQQLFVNKYMENIDVDDLIEKNAEKAKKKNERRGLDPAAIEKAAKQRANTIQDKSAAVTKANKKYDPANYKSGEANYEKGSIASIANMLGNSNNKKDSGKGE